MYFCCQHQTYICATGVPRKLLVRALEQAAGRCKKVSFTDDCDDTIDVAPELPSEHEDTDPDSRPLLPLEHPDIDDIPPLQSEHIPDDSDDVPIAHLVAEPPGAHSSYFSWLHIYA